MPHGTAAYISDPVANAFDLTRDLQQCKVLFVTGENCDSSYYLMAPKLAKYIRFTAPGTHYPLHGLSVAWRSPEGDEDPAEALIWVENRLPDANHLKFNGFPEKWDFKARFAQETQELDGMVRQGAAHVVANRKRFETLLCLPDVALDRYHSMLAEDYSGLTLADDEITDLQLSDDSDQTLRALNLSDEMIARIHQLKQP